MDLVLKETREVFGGETMREDFSKESLLKAFGNRVVVVSDIHPSPPVEGTSIYRNIGYHWNIAFLHYLQEELDCKLKFWGKSKSVFSDIKRIGIKEIGRGRKDFFEPGDIFIRYSLDPYTLYVYVYAGKDPDEIAKWALWERELLFEGFLRYLKTSKYGKIYGGD